MVILPYNLFFLCHSPDLHLTADMEKEKVVEIRDIVRLYEGQD